MRLIQDVVNDIYPSESEIREALEYLDKILPQYKHTTCNGAIGDWRMLPDGQTVFYCPPVLLGDSIEL